MSYIPVQEFYPSIAEGQDASRVAVNKYGRATDADNGVDTDIWSRANPTDAQDIFTPPTQARIHDITSSSANDTAAGTGLQTCRVYGLTSWATKEVNEVITMNGISNVPTSNAYVIIHRIVSLTWGSAGPNVGQITATAQTDGTVTAQVEAGRGQTEMAILGFPSTQELYVENIYTEVIKLSSVNAEVNLLVNTYPDNQLLTYISKAPRAVTPQAPLDHDYKPPLKFAGPGIAKLQVNTDTVNTTVTGGFNGYLKDVL